MCPVLVSAPEGGRDVPSWAAEGIEGWSSCQGRPDYQIWGPLSREDVRLRVNMITAQVEGVGEEERKKTEERKANRCSTTIQQILPV